jgi:hypothetical protein
MIKRYDIRPRRKRSDSRVEHGNAEHIGDAVSATEPV